MAVNADLRNQFTSLETGRRAKTLTRVCIDCPAFISNQAKRCHSCATIIRERRSAEYHAERRAPRPPPPPDIKTLPDLQLIAALRIAKDRIRAPDNWRELVAAAADRLEAQSRQEPTT